MNTVNESKDAGKYNDMLDDIADGGMSEVEYNAMCDEDWHIGHTSVKQYALLFLFRHNVEIRTKGGES